MRNGNKAPRLKHELNPAPQGDPAVDWLRDHLPGGRLGSLNNGKLPRWGRTYNDGSRLKLFFGPGNNSLEVGYYKFPPGSHLLSGCDREYLDYYNFATSIIHEFLPEWYRSKNLIYASEDIRPNHVSSSHNYGVFHDHRYFFENFSPVNNFEKTHRLDFNSPTYKRASKKHALEQLAKDPPSPLSIPSGEKLVDSHPPTGTPRLTDWLRPIMREHHLRQVPAKILVGHYGPVGNRSDHINALKDYKMEKSKSVVAAQVLGEFMPGWEAHGDRLIPKGFKLVRPKTEEDGYRVCRWLTKDYLTYIEPWSNPQQDLIPRYWANLTFFEIRDQALFGDSVKKTYSLPYDVINYPASVWTRNYSDGSQLRIVYEPDYSQQNGNKFQKAYIAKDRLGQPISRERLDVQEKIALELIKVGAVGPPSQSPNPPILKAYPLEEAKSRDIPFFWSTREK